MLNIYSNIISATFSYIASATCLDQYRGLLAPSLIVLKILFGSVELILLALDLELLAHYQLTYFFIIMLIPKFQNLLCAKNFLEVQFY
jgi:hypothetical protein